MNGDEPRKPPKGRRRGYLNPDRVKAVAFWTTCACIVVGVVAALLAIWNFSGTDVLWRTVASCAVIAGGTLALALFNVAFDTTDEA
jgi:sterol desaturase/sphingolipid hydroxylase (fatty acid hydroxylase superfamily)